MATPAMTTNIMTPGWYRALIGWRWALFGALLVLVTTRVGIGLEGINRVALLTGLGVAAAAAGGAAWWSMKRRHIGRLAGFTLDLTAASVLWFLALNRLDFFVGLDVVGARFNRSVAWLLVIVAGWLLSGWAQRPGAERPGLVRPARWVMAAGLLGMLLSMGLLAGLPDAVSRLANGTVALLLIPALAASWFARIQFSDRAADLYRSRRQQTETMEGIAFLAPNAFGFLAFFAGPLIFSLFISFTEWSGLQPAEFVGLDNYAELIGDRVFLKSLRNILVFGIISVPLTVGPALLLAALLNSKLPGIRVFRAVYFLPSIAGVVGVSLIWKQLFNATVGYLNYGIAQTTEFVNGILGTSATAPQPLWISSPNVALISVIILFVWQRIGFDTVLFLAGMQGIDGSLYEAADIDGASAWRRFRDITIPLLGPTTFFVVATDIILALQTFNEPFILQAPSSPAGPGNSTLTPVIYLYQQAFQQFQIGYGSAVAWALFVLIFGVTLLYFRRQGDEGMLKA